MKRIGIIGAMEEEVALLKEQMQIEKKVEKASMEFCAGKLNGQEERFPCSFNLLCNDGCEGDVRFEEVENSKRRTAFFLKKK